MSGLLVTFRLGEGGGKLSDSVVMTDGAGVATAVWAVGQTVGRNTLFASAENLSQVTFVATATVGGVARLNAVTGNDQTAPVVTAVSVRPSVTLGDQFGNPVAGVPVTFFTDSPEEDGAVTGGSQVTDASGVATVGAWTLGPRARQQILRATTPISTIQFRATAIPGPPASITKVAGDGQAALSGTPVSRVPEVVVRDAYLNPLRGATVTFAINGGGGSVTNPVQILNFAGAASPSQWILGATGPQTLSATIAGLPPVTFTAIATAPPGGS